MSGFLAWWRGFRLRDLVTALVMVAITHVGSAGEAHPRQLADQVQFHGHPIPQPTAAAYLLVAVASLALAAWRRWPLTVAAVSTAAVTAYTVLGYVNGAALLAPELAVYGLATRVSVRRAVAAAAAVMVVLMVATGARNPFGTVTGGGFDLIPPLVTAACLGGIAVSSRRAYVASIQARADEQAQRQVDEERLRIARELHDVVAHTMSTIHVQASAAAAVLADRPDVAASALQSIRAASRDGLRELRSIVNVLRQADEADPTTPAPGLGQLGALVATATGTGLPVTVRTSGEAVALAPTTDLAAYRIIQESLTNVIRHAGSGATATVALAYSGTELAIEVADTGRGTPAGGAGHGLIGMRERAIAAGGTLRAGPGPSGGFVVTARLPLEAGTSPLEAGASADASTDASTDAGRPSAVTPAAESGRT